MSTLTPPASTATPATPASPARLFPNPPPFPVARFTVDQYHRMIGAGIFDEDDPVELLDGFIALKRPRNPPHDSTISRLQRLLWTVLGPDWIVRAQSAVTK